MKQQALTQMLILFEDAVERQAQDELRNLVVKSRILRKGGDQCASVVRELLNS